MKHSLEDTIRAYAKKGELVHLSLIATGGAFECVYSAASVAGGHATARHEDPVEACLRAFAASPAKPARVSKPGKRADEEITATVNAEHARDAAEQGVASRDDEPTLTLSEWTK